MSNPARQQVVVIHAAIVGSARIGAVLVLIHASPPTHWVSHALGLPPLRPGSCMCTSIIDTRLGSRPSPWYTILIISAEYFEQFGYIVCDRFVIALYIAVCMPSCSCYMYCVLGASIVRVGAHVAPSQIYSPKAPNILLEYTASSPQYSLNILKIID